MYGFNLGQIEGLDSSVQTVTVTIANATVSNTYTLNYHLRSDDMDTWYDDDETFMLIFTPVGFLLAAPAFTESDVGDTYNVTLSTSTVEENFKSAVETVLVDNGLISESETLFDGTITITAEDRQGVEIPFDVDVSSYPFEKWTVTVNDEPLIYEDGFFRRETETHTYMVGNRDGVYMLLARSGGSVIPGDYQVKIVAQAGSGGGGSGLPEVTDADNGKTLVVVNGAWNKAEGGKSGIRVDLDVTNGTIESVFIASEDKDATLGDLFDYGWENVSQIHISEDGNSISGTFLLQSIYNFSSRSEVSFGVLELPGGISDANANGYIYFIIIQSNGSYTRKYSGTFTITKYPHK